MFCLLTDHTLLHKVLYIFLEPFPIEVMFHLVVGWLDPRMTPNWAGMECSNNFSAKCRIMAQPLMVLILDQPIIQIVTLGIGRDNC